MTTLSNYWSKEVLDKMDDYPKRSGLVVNEEGRREVMVVDTNIESVQLIFDGSAVTSYDVVCQMT